MAQLSASLERAQQEQQHMHNSVEGMATQLGAMETKLHHAQAQADAQREGFERERLTLVTTIEQLRGALAAVELQADQQAERAKELKSKVHSWKYLYRCV